MRAEIKFCGLTRPEDAEAASRLGAAYVGVIFAGGPRAVSTEVAAAVLAAAGAAVRRVGVFGAVSADRIAKLAGTLQLDVAQLHGDPTEREVAQLRDIFDGEIWAVARVPGADLPAGTADLFASADAVVLDARVAGALGGSGRAFDWLGAADALARMRGNARLVLAGGLTPENIAGAMELLRPAVLDVSSGVERSPGIKDHERMRDFVEAVNSVREVA